MQFDLTTFLFAAGTVVLAEMGDKTQLLAMAFAARYKASKVLLGVFLATVLNHALAVALGSLLAGLTSVQVWIQGIASLSFVFFGLWTLRGDRLNGEENRATRFGAVLTVAVAFFLAEMGDKTQLATLALSAKSPDAPAMVLAGTTAGMLVADGIGIIVGVLMCRRIPERTVKLVSAGAFVVFGFIGSYEVASQQLRMEPGAIAAALAGLALVTGLAAYLLIRRNKGIPDALPPCRKTPRDAG